MTRPSAPRPAGPRDAARRRCLQLLAAGPVGLLTQAAHALSSPRGKVVLSVTGRIRHPNAGDRADFDMAMLEALPNHGFSTQAPWFAEARSFSGPLLRDVLAAAGAHGETLSAVALNNYKIDLPVADTQRFKVLLATRMSGKPMAVRDKGPLFIIYPFDESDELRSERYYSRSVWQLRTLHVR